VVVEIYEDRMEISNPGRPFISPERFIDEYQSRNERVADLMRRMGICEEKGSGVDKVVQAAEAYQLPAPDFRVSELRTSVVLFGHLEIEVSVVTSKPASRGHFKTSHPEGGLVIGLVGV
jgi:ATP-dependent DNA helicase RecG